MKVYCIYGRNCASILPGEGGGGTENRWYLHILLIQFQHLSRGGK